MKATVAVAVVLAVVLAATSALVIVRTNQVREARAERAALERELAQAQSEIEDLRADPNGEGDPQPDGLSDLFGEDSPLGDLFGNGELGELFGDLFGDGSGGMADAAEIAACVQDTEPVDVDDSNGETQFDDIEQAVAELRDLDYIDPVEPTYLSAQEIADRVDELIDEEYSAEQAELDRRYLAALGAIQPGLDLLESQKELLGDQVAGFYDSDTGEMVVGTENPDAALNPTDQMTLSHELSHALTDQQLGLPELLDAEQPDSDAALAALALVEGDATLLMQRYALGALDMGEQLGLAMDPRAAEAQAQLAEFPHVLQRSLAFPYEQGLLFACALSQEGGWEAVNAAYTQLPATSAEILFPERYGQPAPAQVSAPSDPGNGWDEVRTDTLGAAELMWLFEAPGDDPQKALSDPLQRVARWDGGAMRLWVNGNDTALGVTFRDRGGEGPSLCDSVTTWYDRAFEDDRGVDTQQGERMALRGPDQSGVFACAGEEVRFGVGPDLATARRIIG